MVGFRNLVGTGIAPVSKKTAVKCTATISNIDTNYTTEVMLRSTNTFRLFLATPSALGQITNVFL